MATKTKARGRKKGSHTKGFFFRAGRGWTAIDPATKSTSILRDKNGRRLTDRADKGEAAESFKRWVKERGEQLQAALAGDRSTVESICKTYLDQCKATGAAGTHELRANLLFDFCAGFPARFRVRPKSERKPSDRIHQGFGSMTIAELKPLHVDQWLAAHPAWGGSRRAAIQAVKRAMNYAVKAGAISRNPIKGHATGKGNARLTYITPEQEHAIYENARPAVALAIKVCIRTGARYGCEFAKLTARHVEISERGMIWRFSAAESKTRKPRLIYIRDSEIIAIVKGLMKQHPTGPLFRNESGEPFDQHALSSQFTRLKRRLARKGIILDAECCMYSCRHSFAKRVLSGYWTGKPTTIEHLAKLMGNTPDVARKYADWCEGYTAPLWEAI